MKWNLLNKRKKLNIKMKKVKIFDILLLFLIAMIWGFAFVAQLNGVKHVGPLTMNGVRFALGAVSLVPVALIMERGRKSKAERKKTVVSSLVAGAVLFAASTLQQIGIEKTGSAGVAGFITGLYMVLIPIACLILFKQKTGFTVWIGALLGLLGLFMLCYKKGEGFYFGEGELLLLIGSLFWTAHVIVIDRMAKDIRPLHFSLGQFTVCAALGLITMLIFESPTFSGIWDAKISILYCGILSVGIAYTLQVIAQKRVSPTFAAIVLSTESVFSAVGGAIFGVDEISLLGYAGCGAMFAGILISQLDFKTLKDKRNK